MSVTGMLTSKDVLEKTGISRATLNNYIKSGILPRPVVGPPRPGDKGVKQIGYFPEDVLARIARVNVLKGRGKTMREIAEIFSAENLPPQPAPEQAEEKNADNRPQQEQIGGRHSRAEDNGLRVTITDIRSPAYLINRNFEIEWINKEAEDLVFAKKVRSIVDSESRNIFRLFLERRTRGQGDDWMDLATLHLTVLQKHIDDMTLGSLFKDITAQEVSILADLFHSRIITRTENVYRLPVAITAPDNIRRNFWVHTMTFREGTFVVFIPNDGINDDLLAILSQREKVINDLLRHRMPSLVSLCVLVADLQDSVRISAELLPAQYFELINGLWEAVGPTFENHKGIYGKHVGDGMLYYFIDKPGENYIINCMKCAFEIRDIVKKFSYKWKGIKGWDNNLFLNTGINEGQEFFGTIHSANKVEFTALGDTINIAGRLSAFAENGEIWTTKHLISKLSQEQRNMFRFGVPDRKRSENGFIRDSFARLGDLLPEEMCGYRQFTAIAGLPITELKERITTEMQ